jgi:hypothetical protein
LTYISLAVYKRELIVVNDMDDFTRYYCFSKKQKQGQILSDKPLPAVEETEDEQKPVIEFEPEVEVLPDDDVL